MSYATFPIDGKDVQVMREPRVPHMLEHVPKDDTIIFVETDISDFKIEEVPREINMFPVPIENEVSRLSNKMDFGKCTLMVQALR